ncbi:uncharacterized protein DUF4328 [Nocardia tenerifensis]|uniref:Uncharacterized protein DUF4328 n=1 Tax=Nocardia tenerifensis TaxID=228006 RepID=A0A318K2S0_9NOCA|nr:DUF4328 domain-containing protein [Nocardia tenerifensis]PXX63020.1 uncharacterized protein DUF4328 [Nocardia tenerifensis]
MSTVVQPCARCGARWAVQSTPMHWCPRCRGVLLSPAPIDAPAERRNYRWVARKPDHRARRSPATGRTAASRETPRYTQIPRWGLLDPPPRPAAAEPRPLTRLTKWASTLLIATAALFAVAAVAELLRYLLLLRNRTRLIHPALLLCSDVFVVGAALLALLLALVTAVAVIGWLIDARRLAFREAGRADPRSVRTLVLGCVIPVVNLLWPGVFLTELVARRADPRALRAIRIWWAAWVFGGLVTTAALAWRTADSLQVKADGVVFTAFTDLVAGAVALLTLAMMRAVEDRDALGRDRTARRWLVAVDPPVPVIEPVQPGGRATAVESAPVRETDPAVASAPRDTDDDHGAVDREHEEVLAK